VQEDLKPRGLGALLEAMRPHQWTKNAFVLAPLVYSRNANDPVFLARALEATVAFCLVSSGVYILNDWRDQEADRAHPKKRHRPIPSGRLGKGPAIGGALACLSLGLGLGAHLSQGFLLVVLGYLFQNVLYTLWLKRVTLLDVFLIANGFVLRAGGGAVALGVPFSQWLLLCTVTLSLFLGFAKRRSELIELGEEAARHRQALAEYTVGFLDQMISISASATVLAYALTTRSPEVIDRIGTPYLMATTPFVFYGIFRYLYLLHVRGWGADPARALLRDRPLLICCLLWAATSVALIYAGPAAAAP
jgi:4-hydroxybenzoate polyprenyltransferase